VPEDDNSENEQESNTPPIICTIQHNDAMCLQHVLYVGRRKQHTNSRHPHIEQIARKILKEAFRKKDRKVLTLVFVKTQ
jgi:hypothetical protein